MKNFTKLLAILLALFMIAIPMVACGEDDDDDRKDRYEDDDDDRDDEEDEEDEDEDRKDKDDETETETETESIPTLEIYSVDYASLLTVTYAKYSGYASAEVTVNYDYFYTLIREEVMNEYMATLPEEVIMNCDLNQCFTAEIEGENTNLKNGDTLKVNIVLHGALTENGYTLADYAAGLGLDFADGYGEFTVEGLVEPTGVVDIFEGIEQYIDYRGANGNGYIGYGQIEIPDDYFKQVGDIYLTKGSYTNSVNIVHVNERIGEIYYYIEGSGFTQGDVLEITTDGFYDKLEELGYIVPATTLETVVPDLGEYITSAEQITPEVLDGIKSYINDVVNGEALHKLYLATYNPGIICNNECTTFVVGVCYDDGWFGGYYSIDVIDIIAKPDGSIVVGEYDKNWSNYDTIEEVINNFDTKSYTFTEIELNPVTE